MAREPKPRSERDGRDYNSTLPGELYECNELRTKLRRSLAFRSFRSRRRPTVASFIYVRLYKIRAFRFPKYVPVRQGRRKRRHARTNNGERPYKWPLKLLPVLLLPPCETPNRFSAIFTGIPLNGRRKMSKTRVIRRYVFIQWYARIPYTPRGTKLLLFDDY